MKKLVFRFSIILGVIASLICFMPNLTNKTYAAQENTQVSHYLLDNDGKAYLSTVEAGQVSGYGSYAVGYQATLQATASAGFDFIGWEVDGEIHTSSFAKSYDFTDDSVANPEIVNYTVTNGVSNSLIISKVPKDLIVRAVFDYQYINLSIDENIIETLALNKETLSVKGEQIEVLYPQDTQSSFKTQSNGITTYTNAIVNSNYFKQVHFDGESLYTTPLKHTTDSETIKIDYSRGAFRYNDGYNVEFDLNLVAKMEDSKNYDVKSFYVNGVTIADANVDIVKDEFLRTSSFAVSGSIVENSLLTWKADMLTVVDLVPYVKNGIQLAEATGDDVAIIANQVRIDHHYSKVSNSRYLIKHSSLNANKQPATIKYEQFAGKQVEGENYFYFEIDSIRDSADNVFKKNNNFELGIVPTKAYEQFKMVYAPINFEIKFEARLSSNLNEKFTELDLNMSSQLRVRGQQYSLSSDDVSYAGYELKGFSTDLVDIQEDSITVEIDKNKPRDITIYLIFDKIDYVVRLNNVNNLILTKNNPDSTTTTIYTIASVKAYKGAQLTESYSETENANAGLFTQNSYLFITNYLLKESFKVQINASAGFKIGLSLSPSAMNSAVLNRSVELSQLIDEEFLNEYASGIKVENGKYIIELYLHAEYETYTFTYKINPATHGSNSVIMADISATKPDRDDVVMTQTEEGSTDPKSKVITITNVRLYDEIIIKAVVKTLPGSTNYYTFQKFISSGGIGLSGVVNNKPEFTYTYVVAGEETITAVLSAPESQLQISIDNAAAYDIGQIQVFFDKNKDGEVTLAEEDLATSENDVFMVSGEIKVVLNGIANIEAGYYYSGFELYLFEDGVEQSAGIETEFAGGVISFIMVSPEAHELRISCPEKTYKISATQVGAGVPDSDVEFSGDLSFINLSMSNLLLEFNYPKDGIYASVVTAKGQDISVKFAQEYNGTSTYSKLLTREELIELESWGKPSVTQGVVEIQLDFQYSLVTFSVSVELLQEAASGKKTYENINDYVDVVVSYMDGETEVFVDDANIDKTNENKIVISNIPYAAQNLTLNVNVSENVGLTHFKWQETQDGAIDASVSTKVVFANNILSNKVLQHSVQYKLYEVKLEYNTDEAAPTVNGELGTAEISALDSLVIDSKALKSNGYKFVAMYQKYVYDANTWATEKTNLFVKTKNGFAQVVASTAYDPAQTYYLRMDMDQTNANLFKVDELSLADFYVKNDRTITMLMVYDYIEIKIVNVSQLDPSSETINKSVEDFAEIKIKSGETVFEADEKFNISTGKVKVEVCMSNIEVNGLTINLMTGVDFIMATTVLADGQVLTWNVIEKDDEKNIFSFEIEISSIIPYVNDNAESVAITYMFKVKTFKATLTTNVPSSANFYTQWVGDKWTPAFVMTASNDADLYASSYFESKLEVTRKFTDQVKFSYYFSEVYGSENVFEKYFKINKVVIKAGGTILTSLEQTENGIKVSSSDPIIVETLSLIENLVIELQVEPIVYLNGATDGTFNKTYKFDFDKNEGVAQSITIGTTADCNVQMSEFLYEALVKDGDEIVLDCTTETGNFVADMVNVGTYILTFYFQEEGEYGWLSQLALINQVKIKIDPLELELSQTGVTETLQKEYDGNTSISFDALRKFINISGYDYKGELKKTNLAVSNIFAVNCTSALIVDETGKAASGARDVAYNVKFENLTHTNANFTIKNSETFKIDKCVKINRKLLTISNIQFYDKVYDGTTELSFSNMGEVNISGIVSNGDDVRLNFENIIIEFEDAEIGLNKKVIIKNYEDCLIGTAKGNYIVDNNSFKITTSPSIYPYSVFTNVEGYGKIEIVNERGKTDQSCVALIPIGAELHIEKFDRGGSTYADMYQIIEEYLSGNREFVVGYTMNFVVDGKERKISNQLYLKLPTVESLRNILSITGEEVVNLKYDISDSQATIDLSQVQTDISTFVLISNRSLFKIWQIILIVGIIAVVLGSIIIAIVIVRRRKLKKYSINEKI